MNTAIEVSVLSPRQRNTLREQLLKALQNIPNIRICLGNAFWMPVARFFDNEVKRDGEHQRANGSSRTSFSG